MTALAKPFSAKKRKFGIFLVLLVALHFPWTKTELKIVEYDQDKVQEYDQDKTEMKIVEYDKILIKIKFRSMIKIKLKWKLWSMIRFNVGAQTV